MTLSPPASDTPPVVTVRDESDLVACEADKRVLRAYAYWRKAHTPAGLPGRPQIDPLQLRDLLPFVWLVDVQREPLRLRYRLIGTAVVDVLGRDMTGQWFDEAHPDPQSQVSYLNRAGSVIQERLPNWRRGRPNLWMHQTYTTVQNLIMPLAADGTHVDMLFNVSTFSRAGKS